MADERMVALAQSDPEMRAYFENGVCRCRPCNAVRTALLQQTDEAPPTAQSDEMDPHTRESGEGGSSWR